MAALFTPRSNQLFRTTLVLAAVLGVGSLCALWIFMRTPFVTNQRWIVEQPVEFDHRHHVIDDGIDCLYCHAEAERSSTAGLPSSAVCMGCHNQIWPDGITLEPVRRSWASGRPIPWGRVHDLPDFVYFDHSIHLHKGIGCASCHGRVDSMARVFQTEPLTMGWCLDCHRDPLPHLRPRAAITDMNWPMPTAAPLGSALATEYRVAAQTTCSTCHR